MQFDTPWTAAKVAEALVRAFKKLPGYPVLSCGRTFVDHEAHEVTAIAPLRWPERFVRDMKSRRVLLTWARCIATGDSVRQAYAGFEWNRSTAERRRVAALNEIVSGLERERSGLGLDSGIKRLGR